MSACDRTIPPGPPSILVVRFSSLGDVLLTTPVLRAIRAHWPQAHLAFLTRERFAPLLEGNPHLDELIRLPEGATARELAARCRELARRRWTILADLHRSLRSSLVRKLVPAQYKLVYSKLITKRTLLIYGRMDRYGPHPLAVPERYARPLERFGVRLDQLPAELHLSDQDHAPVAAAIASRWPDTPENFLTVAPGAAWPIKRWPAERFAVAAGELSARHSLKVLVLGGAQDAEVCRTVAERLGASALDLAGQLTIRQSAAAVERSRLLLTNDTGLMHVATAVRTPVTAVFGPTVRQLGYFPYRSAARVVEHPGLWCRPCTHNGRSRCPLGHFRCLRELGPSAVITAAEELLTADC